MALFARLAGIIGNFFQLGGPTGPQWKNNGGAIEARNAADSGYVIVRGLPPVGASDFVTLGSLVAPPGSVTAIRIPIALVNANSVAALPVNAVITRAFVDVTTAYSPGATITVGTAAVPNAFLDVGDSNPQAIALYDAPQDTVSVAGGVLLVTIAGAPAIGAGFVYVEYSIPLV